VTSWTKEFQDAVAAIENAAVLRLYEDVTRPLTTPVDDVADVGFVERSERGHIFE